MLYGPFTYNFLKFSATEPNSMRAMGIYEFLNRFGSMFLLLIYFINIRTFVTVTP